MVVHLQSSVCSFFSFNLQLPTVLGCGSHDQAKVESTFSRDAIMILRKAKGSLMRKRDNLQNPLASFLRERRNHKICLEARFFNLFSLFENDVAQISALFK